jgi:hypothetical protein
MWKDVLQWSAECVILLSAFLVVIIYHAFNVNLCAVIEVISVLIRVLRDMAYCS